MARSNPRRSRRRTAPSDADRQQTARRITTQVVGKMDPTGNLLGEVIPTHQRLRSVAAVYRPHPWEQGPTALILRSDLLDPKQEKVNEYTIRYAATKAAARLAAKRIDAELIARGLGDLDKDTRKLLQDARKKNAKHWRKKGEDIADLPDWLPKEDDSPFRRYVRGDKPKDIRRDAREKEKEYFTAVMDDPEKQSNVDAKRKLRQFDRSNHKGMQKVVLYLIDTVPGVERFLHVLSPQAVERLTGESPRGDKIGPIPTDIDPVFGPDAKNSGDASTPRAEIDRTGQDRGQQLDTHASLVPARELARSSL